MKRNELPRCWCNNNICLGKYPFVKLQLTVSTQKVFQMLNRHTEQGCDFVRSDKDDLTRSQKQMCCVFYLILWAFKYSWLLKEP